MSSQRKAATSTAGSSTAARVAAINGELTEKEFSAQIYELARLLGYRRYHTYRAKRSPAGFPDEVLCRERVVFVEVKREKTRTTAEQKDWLRALRDAGAEVYVVRPRNLDDLATVLAGKPSRPDTWTAEHFRLVAELDKELAG